MNSRTRPEFHLIGRQLCNPSCLAKMILRDTYGCSAQRSEQRKLEDWQGLPRSLTPSASLARRSFDFEMEDCIAKAM